MLKYIFVSFSVLFFHALLFAQNLTSGEYFFDTEPGNGKAQTFSFVSDAQVAGSIELDISTLSPGFHFLYTRVKNSAGVWSHYEGRSFYILENSTYTTFDPQPNLVQGEWFIDTDPGNGKATAFSFASIGEVSKSLDIDLANLSEGFHQLFIRVKAENGRWSHYEGRMFYVIEPSKYTMSENQPMLSAAEYFMDKDPGLGKGKPISLLPADSVSILADLDVSNLPEGPHTLSVRVRNSKGVWSLYEKRSFFIIETAPILPLANTQLKAYEWYVDKDPGFGKGTKLAVALTDTLVSAIDLTMLNLTDGEHVLFLRVQNTLHQWSLQESRKFTVCTNVLSPPVITSQSKICVGDTLYLTGKSVVGATSYFWKGPTSFTQAGLKVVMSNADILKSGEYNLYAVRAGGTGCDTSNVNTFVTVMPVPEVTFDLDTSICDTVKSIQLTVGVPSGGVYSGEHITNNTFTTTSKAGSYIVNYSYKAKNGCFSDAYASVEVVNCTQNSVDELPFSGIAVYPNPTTDILYLSSIGKSLLGYTVQISDVLGRELYTEKVSNISTKISIQKIGASGIYYVHIYDAFGVFVQSTQFAYTEN